MKDAPEPKDSRNIKDADPYLQECWPTILKRYEKANPGYTLWITCTHRTPEMQLILYKKGRQNEGSIPQPKYVVTDASKVVTNCDGFKKLSPHNEYPSLAMDVCAVNMATKAVTWEVKHYLALGEICRSLKLEWGGNWIALSDLPHIQIGKTWNSSKHIGGFYPPGKEPLPPPEEPNDQNNIY